MSKALDGTGLGQVIDWISTRVFKRSEGVSVGTIGIDNSPTSNSGNLVASGGVYGAIHPAVGTSQPSGGFLPNVFYNLGELAGDTTFTLAAATDNTIVNHYYWTFDTPSTAPTITWPTGLTWVGGSAPTVAASKHYEVSVINGIATYMEV